MVKFKCSKCNSDQIKFQKVVTVTKNVVVHPDGHIQYRNPVTDDSDDEFGSKFTCGACKKPILLYGDYITNEFLFKKYLKLSKKQRRQMQEEYEKQLELEAQSETARLAECESICCDEPETIDSDPEN